MCGRYGVPTNIFKLIERLEFYRKIDQLRELIPKKKEFYPGSKIPVIRRRQTDITAELIAWGIKPDWADRIIINARKEKVMSSNFWRTSFLQERCLIPASYFIEWQMSEGKKIPWQINLKDEELFCFAGIIVNGQSESTEHCVIMTEEANPLMRDIHNHGPNRHRQPLIIPEDRYESWISHSDMTDMLSAESFPAQKMGSSKLYDNEKLLF